MVAFAGSHPSRATKGILDLDYGEAIDLNADLTPFAATGMEIEINGDGDDSNPVRPIICTVTATSGRGTPGEVTVGVQQTLIADGTENRVLGCGEGSVRVSIPRQSRGP